MPRDRLSRRTKQRRRKRRNEKRRNQHKGGNGGGGGGGGVGNDQCAATGDDCTQASDCCSNNCLDFGCAAKVHTCGATACHPAANACAGETCCYGSAVCNGTCCDAPANQCNPQGECCAPNCSGRECGTDGCGGGGTCGTCSGGATCNEASGQCEEPCDVCPSCTYTTVQAAVNDNNGPATIRICPGVYNESITIRRPLTLVGSGQGSSASDTILLGAGGTVVTNYASGGQVQLQDLRITGGDAGSSGSGGGVFHAGVDMTMTNCTITGNLGQIGAGIYVANRSTLWLYGCTVSKNHADSQSGLGGGIFMGIGNTVLSGCTVTENTALGVDGIGGGIAVYGEGNLNLLTTLITGNKATVIGGGIYNVGGMVGLDDGKNVTGNTPDNCSGQVAGCQN
jgi:hypothetical protein